VLSALRRHPFPVEAFFEWSLVLAYALPARALAPMLPAGLVVDTYGDLGFLAIALVQTDRLRPKGFPAALGRRFFLSGYRVFARLVRPGKPPLRGLRILRSDTDRRSMVALGNLFTHYGYRFADVAIAKGERRLAIDVRTPGAEADLHVEADLASPELPEGSPFPSLEDARAFAGPLPYTFDLDAPTGKMLLVRGLRTSWAPRPVRIVSETSTFLARPELARESPRLANAFFVENVHYAWKPGVLEDAR
jgi:hypothetical protein